MIEPEFREKVVKGISVNWYPKAMTDKEPKTALVVSSNSNGSVDLCVFDDGGMFRVRACYHKTCKSSLFDHAGKRFPHVTDSGCWDFNEASALLYRMLKETQAETNCVGCGVEVGETAESDVCVGGSVPDESDVCVGGSVPDVRRKKRA